jgi:hypothetical protein
MIDVAALFAAAQDGVKLTNGLGDIIVRQHAIHDVTFPTGSVAACDPLVLSDSVPFQQRIPPGRYPVVLSVAQFLANGDRRVAAATLRVSADSPVAWKLATRAGQNAAALKDDEIYGYGVDSGCGSLMAQEASEWLDQKYRADPTYFHQVIEQLSQTYETTWGWARLELSEPDRLNAAVFSSGFGDGYYASYWGYNGLGQVVCLITDFGILID